MSKGFFPWGLRLGSGSTAAKPNVEYTGKAYPVPADATSSYARLLDKGKKPLDNATLYSGQQLEGDGVDDYVGIGDISASCKSLEITIDPATTTEGIIQLASGVSISISSGTISTAGLSNVTAYVNSVAGTTVAAELTVLALTFDAVDCSDVQLFFNGSDYFNGSQGNVKLWAETLDSDDVVFSYAHPESPAYNRPGTSLTAANLKGWWPLIAGSGDTAYDWSGNGNHGTLTGFTDVQTAWDNAAGLSDPRVCQTALMSWNLDAGVLRPVGTSGGTDFTREYNELNWNGRSYANCGNGVDVNPSTAVIIEMAVGAETNPDSSTFILGGKQYGSYISTGGTLSCSITTDTETQYLSASGFGNSGLRHVILTFSASSQQSKLYTDSVMRATKTYSDSALIAADTDNFNLGHAIATSLTGQLPLFRMITDADAQKIIDKGLDAWVAKRYAKAQSEYNLGE